MSIHVKLAKVQAQLHAPKSQINNFGGYNYRSCEDILQAVKPLLGDCTITITDDMVAVGDRVYVKATATFTDGAETVTTTAFAREPEQAKGKDVSQITGSSSSYARKYALNGLLLIDDNKDADSQDNRKQGTREAEEESRREALMAATQANQASIDTIKQGIADGAYSVAAEAWFELDNDTKQSLWVAPTKGGPFTTEERRVMQTKEFRESYYGPSNQDSEA